MGIKKVLILSGVVASMLLMNGCNGSDDSENAIDGKKNVNKDVLDPDRSFNTTFDGKLFSIPSPIQTALLIKSLKIPFDGSLLSEKGNVVKYDIPSTQAINLGVYGADLGYATLYNQHAQSLNYLSIVEDLSKKLGISGTFDKSFVDRYESNSENEDSLLMILTDGFRRADNFLKNNDQNNISALILTGGWLESMYFATQLYKGSKNEKILTRIGEQNQSLETIIELLEKYNDNGQNDLYITIFKDLNTLFSKVESTYKYVEPETDEKNRITTIKSKMDIVISEELAEEIVNSVKNARTKIVESDTYH